MSTPTAAQRGAADSLAAILRARHPNLSIEVTIPGEGDQGASPPTRSAEPIGSVAPFDDPHPIGNRTAVSGLPPQPDDRERAA